MQTAITIDASDSGDIDTVSPSGVMSISWPGWSVRRVNSTNVYLHTLRRGTIPIRAIATDDDGEQTEVISSIQVLNVAPTIGEIEVWIAGVNTPFDANGTWVLKEDQTVILRPRRRYTQRP